MYLTSIQTQINDEYGNSLLNEMPILGQNFIKHYEQGIDPPKQFKNQLHKIYVEFKEFYCLE